MSIACLSHPDLPSFLFVPIRFAMTVKFLPPISFLAQEEGKERAPWPLPLV